MNQYEKDKNTEIEKELGTQIKVPEVKKGWNEWAGAGGLNDAKHQLRVERAEKIKQQRITELKKTRMDSKMKGVVVNLEDRDKKFAQKYLINELPYNYKSQEQF